MGNSVAVLMQIYFSVCMPIIIEIRCGLTVIAKIEGCCFLPHNVDVCSGLQANSKTY